MEEKLTGNRAPLTRGELDPHRTQNTRAGMWAWMAQRTSALALVVLVVLHLAKTYNLLIQFLLLFTVAFHAALGLRVILLDFNLVSVKYHRMLIWGLLALAVVITLIVWFSIY